MIAAARSSGLNKCPVDAERDRARALPEVHICAIEIHSARTRSSVAASARAAMRNFGAVSHHPPSKAINMSANCATWTSERIELLKRCLHAGLSCGQTAREIGVTPNAVIGKMNRLGLSRPKDGSACLNSRGAPLPVMPCPPCGLEQGKSSMPAQSKEMAPLQTGPVSRFALPPCAGMS
jgi:hypothetical protein